MDKKIIEDINKYIDSEKDEMLATLKKYIQFRSFNFEMLEEGQKSEFVDCQKWVADVLEKTGYFDKVEYYEIEEGRPNVAAVRKGNGDGRSLMLNGHSDVVTVSPEQEQAWTGLTPFDGGVKDGKVWGRGATDMKSGNVAAIYAAKALKALGLKLEGDLLLTFVDGEESGRAEIGIWSLKDKGYTADFGIMCEPSGLATIANRSKGEIYYDIKVKGASTHICNRYKTIWPQKRKEDQIGVNAIDKMVKLINAFSELERSWGLTYYHPEMEPGLTTLTVSRIRGGDSFSAQADECSMTIASLFAPNISLEEIRKQILDTIKYIADHDHWLKDHRPVYSLPFPPKVPLDVKNDDDGVTTAISSCEAVLGFKPEPRILEGVGDANYMFEKGMKCINWGPGVIGVAHSTNEYVDVQEFIDTAKAYASMAIHWCGIKNNS